MKLRDSTPGLRGGLGSYNPRHEGGDHRPVVGGQERPLPAPHGRRGAAPGRTARAPTRDRPRARFPGRGAGRPLPSQEDDPRHRGVVDSRGGQGGMLGPGGPARPARVDALVHVGEPSSPTSSPSRRSGGALTGRSDARPELILADLSAVEKRPSASSQHQEADKGGRRRAGRVPEAEAGPWRPSVAAGGRVFERGAGGCATTPSFPRSRSCWPSTWGRTGSGRQGPSLKPPGSRRSPSGLARPWWPSPRPSRPRWRSFPPRTRRPSGPTWVSRSRASTA